MEAEADGEYATARPTKFRLKSKRRRRDEGGDSRPRKRRRSEDDHSPSRHHHHNRSRRRFPSPSPSPLQDDPSLYDDTYLPNARSSQYLGPDQAFRESLFDALADDEGAAYWEGVYGQPMHTYSRPESTRPNGELEQMSDDEYAAYVRAKMYEKTHQHAFEERARREEAKKRRKEEQERFEDEARASRRWQEKVEESLKRGEERKKGRRWREAWEAYLHGWEMLKTFSLAGDGEEEDLAKAVRRAIPWPVVTGRWKDVSKDDTEDFFNHAPEDLSLYTLLKTERVRWHPDKMQQRFGGTGIDSETMKSVTLVFQVVDRMWSDMRENRKP